MPPLPAPPAADPGHHAAGPAEASRASAELAEVRARLHEAQATIDAIRDGGVDSLIIGTSGHEQVFALGSADRPYRLILEAMGEGAVTISPRGVILDANPRLGAMTGRSTHELIGTAAADLIPVEHRATFSRLLEAGVGDSARGELELTTTGGRAVPVQASVSGFDLDGMFLRSLVLTDLTALQAAQAETAAADEARRESEGRLAALVKHAPVGIKDLGPHDELVQVNDFFCQLTGYSADELRSMRVQDITHPDDVAADLASLERLRSGEIDGYSMHKRYVRKDGGVVWGELSRNAVPGPPPLFVSVVRDITEQRQAEAEVRALNAELETRVEQRTAELERANQSLESFSYSVSHDLRAPLRALSGFSEALVEEYGDQLEETGRGYAGRIQAASERMATLIDEMLHLSRVSGGELRLEPVDLSAEVAATAEELRSHEPGRRVRFVVQPGVWVTADRSLIRSVVQNLADNAWKFTARRDNATIEFGTAAIDDGQVCCYMRDNGAGFDPVYAGKLFQPFQRLHAESDFPGTGIGLASIRRIIERHGGRTWAEGAVGEGASIFFTLDPAAPPHPLS